MCLFCICGSFSFLKAIFVTVNNAKHIRVCIQFRIDHWNCGAFDELLKDNFNMSTGCLGKSSRIQIKEQRHCTFLNLVLKGRFCEAVRLSVHST